MGNTLPNGEVLSKKESDLMMAILRTGMLNNYHIEPLCTLKRCNPVHPIISARRHKFQQSKATEHFRSCAGVRRQQACMGGCI